MEFMSLTPVNVVLLGGITWLSGMFVWLLKRFIKSYDDNTRTLVEINKTIMAMDAKLDTANEIDREILLELARVSIVKAS